jgi:hypothetical protein
MTTYYQDPTTYPGTDGVNTPTWDIPSTRSTVPARSSKLAMGIAGALTAVALLGVGAEVTLDALRTPDSISVGDGPTSTQETTLTPTLMGTETAPWLGIPAQGNLNRRLPSAPGIPAQGNLNQPVGN